MPIEIACASCGKRYRVDDKLAGKRVKCKTCGNAIDVQAPVGEDDDDLAAFTAAAMSMESMASQAGIDSPPPLQPTRPVMPDRDEEGVFARPTSGELPDGFGPAIAAARARLDNRPFRLFPYPGNSLVDQLLPWLITLACLVPSVWSAVTDTMSHNTPDDPMWIPTVEYSVVFLLFLGLVVPVATRGLRMASNTLHFPVPDSAVWRMMSIASVCLALATAMYWHIGVPGVVLGIAVGILIAWPLVWLFFSLHWAEAIVAWMMSSLFLISGAAVVALITVVISLISAAALTSDAKPTKALVKMSPRASSTSTSPSDTTQPTDVIASLPTTQPGDVAVAPGTGSPSTGPATLSTTPPVAVAPVDPSPPGDIVFTPVAPATLPSALLKPGDPGDVLPGVGVSKPKVSGSPLIASVKSLDWLGVAASLVQSSGAGAPLTILRSSGDEQTLVIADADQAKAAGSISFKPDTHVDQTCMITPSGDAMVRVVSWPKLSLQVTSLNDSTVLQSLPLSDTGGGSPLLVGLPNADTAAIRYQKNGQTGLELWNLKTGTRGKQIALAGQVENGIAFSMDGKQAAVVSRPTEGGPAQLTLIDLATSRSPRKLPITALDPQWAATPAGLEFSPDGKLIALAVEHETGVLIVVWNVATGKAVGEHTFPPGMLAVPMVGQFKGSALSWVDANTWLLYGRTMIDATTGKSLGTLDLDRVTAQRVAGDGVIDLLATADDGNGRVQKVTLSPEGIAKARGGPAGPTTAK